MLLDTESGIASHALYNGGFEFNCDNLLLFRGRCTTIFVK